MELGSFYFLWDKCIKRASDDIIAYCGAGGRKDCNLRLDDSDATRRLAFDRYNLYRGIIHDSYFQGERIDAHKIAACVIGAVTDVKPLHFDSSGSLPPVTALSNYYLAFFSGIHILRFFLAEEYRHKGKKEYFDRLVEQKRFTFPRTTAGHETYSLGRIKNLSLNDYYGVPFDALVYADMLYWIDLYNRQIIEETVTPELRIMLGAGDAT